MTISTNPPASLSEEADPAVADHAEAHARNLAGGNPRLTDFIEAVSVLAQLIRAYLRGEFRLTWQEAGVLLAAIAYLINPVDALPEALLGPAGLPDDIAAIAAAVGTLSSAILRFKKHTTRTSAV